MGDNNPGTDTPILIDTGRSRAGWSFWGPWFKCMRLGALINVYGKQFVSGDALIQGSMGHTILGHHYARIGAEQGGVRYGSQWFTDPEAFMEPYEALDAWVERREDEGVECAHFLHNIRAMYQKYVQEEPVVRDRVLEVETEHVLTAGYNANGDFGLWNEDNLYQPALLNEPRLQAIEEAPPSVQGLVPQIRHGGRIEVTKSYDLVTRSARDSRDYIVDHKCKGGSIGKRAAQMYMMDGQFAVNRIGGAQEYENFGGVVLNFVRRVSPYTRVEQLVPNSPYRDQQFSLQVWNKAHEIAAVLADEVERGLGSGVWQMAQDEQTCWGRYGACGGMQYCRFGGA